MPTITKKKSTKKTATATKSHAHRAKKPSTATRHPRFTELEKQIIQDGVDHGVAKALAVNMLRQFEAEGRTPEQIAEQLRVNDLAVDGTPSKALGKPTGAPQGDPLMPTAGDDAPSGDAEPDIEALLDQLFAENAGTDVDGSDSDEESEDEDEESEDEKGL